MGVMATLHYRALPKAAFNILPYGIDRETCLSPESMRPPANFASPPVVDFRDRWHLGIVWVLD